MTKRREVEPEDLVRIEKLLQYLRLARAVASRLRAPKTLAKVRSALKSAEGAQRHINLCKNEQERAKTA